MGEFSISSRPPPIFFGFDRGGMTGLSTMVVDSPGIAVPLSGAGMLGEFDCNADELGGRNPLAMILELWHFLDRGEMWRRFVRKLGSDRKNKLEPDWAGRAES